MGTKELGRAEIQGSPRGCLAAGEMLGVRGHAKISLARDVLGGGQELTQHPESEVPAVVQTTDDGDLWLVPVERSPWRRAGS